MYHARHDLLFTLFNIPVSLNNKDPKSFRLSVISCMPIKPAHAFQAFKREGEGVIKAQDNALVVRLLFQSSPRDIRKRELISQKGRMA